MTESTNMLAALCLPEMPELNENSHCMWIDKIEFLLTQSRVDYALTAEESPKGSKKSYEKDNKTCCSLLLHYMTYSM